MVQSYDIFFAISKKKQLDRACSNKKLAKFATDM